MNCPHCGHEIAAPAGVTGRQKDVLDYIKGYIGAHGIAPSYAEIGKAVGIKSTARTHVLVYDLADRGHLTVKRYHARSIALVAP